jgi:uncharacterized membrane protein YphA (DoxX/SURF4 family)
MKKVIYHFSRIFLGLVFTFSGFVKAVDPMGTAIKFNDYFNYAFNLPGLTEFSLLLSFIMCGFELWTGILLLLNTAPKLSSFFTLMLMIVFTPLTLYLAIANPVSDCGCFGDAVKMTNWQTFYKNVVIDFFLLLLFLTKKDINTKKFIVTKFSLAVLSVLAIVGFELYNYNYLPVIDFMPYKVGANIPELMKIPDDAPKDEYEISFVYKNSKTGEVKDFTEENYPWQDTTWVWQETKTKLIKQGYIPPIHGFVLTDTNGVDVTDSIIHNKEKSLIIVTYTLEKAKYLNMVKVKNFIDVYLEKSHDTKVYCFTSSDDAAIRKFRFTLSEDKWIFCKIDETVAKTIIRSNPGLVVLKDGTIMNKYHYHSLNMKKIDEILKY